MTGFTASYLAELTASLTVQILNGIGRKLRETISGTEKEQAIERCLRIGLAALLATASAKSKDEVDLLSGIFRKFFGEPDVGKELGALLRGNQLNREELLYLFEHAGFEAKTLPGTNFEQALTAFEAAFLIAATDESELQGTIQTSQLLSQTHLLGEIRDSIRDLVSSLRQTGLDTLAVRNGSIMTGQAVIYQFPSIKILPSGTGDWEGHYLRTLISQCEPLDLTAIDETYASGETGAISVSDVFTTLYLARLTRSPRQTVAAAIRRQDEHDLRKQMQREEKRLPIQAVEAVAAMPRLVILGQPGGGKSTLVNHLVTQLGCKRLGRPTDQAKLPGWAEEEKPLPVRIILRRFAAWIPAGASRGEGLVWKYLETQLEQCGCKEAFPSLRHQLTDDSGIVFFDGLDEVRETDEEAKRSLITAAIAEFAKPLDKCRVVITCREYAYKPGSDWRLPEKTFPVVDLDLFGKEQIEYFTQTWYRVVGPQKGWNQEKCREESQHLFDAIQHWPHLQDLAEHPLLLTLMAQVHGQLGTLPDDRADLYERAVNLLLAHWENRIVRDLAGNRKVEPGLIMELGIRSETLRLALERVAFAAHERQEKEQARDERAADIPKEDLYEILKADLGDANKAELVIAYIQERAGLLQARDNRIYTFPHKTFQEYLTATHLLKQGEPDVMLRERMKRDLIWWREVFLLAAGASRRIPSTISNLVDTLIPLPHEENKISADKAQQAQAAAQALTETDFVEHVHKEELAEAGRFSVTYRKIQNSLIAGLRSAESLAATERAACGNALARLGDTRFRSDAWFLPDEPMLGFVEIPAGEFWMGSNKKKDSQAYDDELNQHKVKLPFYYIAHYPVTVAQFQTFVDESGYKPEHPEYLHGLSNHPVVNVTWYEALKYCEWLTERLRNWQETPKPLASLLKQQGWRITLPSEAEWEKAARGTNGLIYPWGDTADASLANYSDTGIGATSAVGCFPGGASQYSCEEMSGNVLEWTRSVYKAYPYRPEDGRENLEAEKDIHRVVRGGAFYYDHRLVRCSLRLRFYPDGRYDYIGFRVVLSP